MKLIPRHPYHLRVPKPDPVIRFTKLQGWKPSLLVILEPCNRDPKTLHTWKNPSCDCMRPLSVGRLAP